jgi:hypothetical protein
MRSVMECLADPDGQTADCSSSSSLSSFRPPLLDPLRRILSIATPALASLALDPLMSAADTAFVGRMAGTGELGGLAVATTVVTVSFYMFNFLSTSTAPLVASVRASGNEEEAAELAGTALTSALIIGTGLAATIFTLAAPLSAMVAGADGNPTVLQAAEGIVRIRAVGAPAALLVSAATGAFRQARTPCVLPKGSRPQNPSFSRPQGDSGHNDTFQDCRRCKRSEPRARRAAGAILRRFWCRSSNCFLRVYPRNQSRSNHHHHLLLLLHHPPSRKSNMCVRSVRVPKHPEIGTLIMNPQMPICNLRKLQQQCLIKHLFSLSSQACCGGIFSRPARAPHTLNRPKASPMGPPRR